MKSATCKKEFSSSSSRNDKENLNLSFLSVTNPQISETSCDSESSPLFMSPIPPKRLSDIQDENEKSTDKSQNSPHFGFLNSSENRKRTPDFIEIKEDLQEDSLLKLPQLKKLLTEENQLSTLKPEIPAFSFQETPLPNSNNLLKPIKESQEEEDLQRLGEEKNSELEQKELEKPLINKTPEKEKKYHEKDREESKGNNTDNSAYVYSYSMKKANKKLSEEYGIEKVITPIKSSSRKKTSHSLKICKIKWFK